MKIFRFRWKITHDVKNQDFKLSEKRQSIDVSTMTTAMLELPKILKRPWKKYFIEPLQKHL